MSHSLELIEVHYGIQLRYWLWIYAGLNTENQLSNIHLS